MKLQEEPLKSQQPEIRSGDINPRVLTLFMRLLNSPATWRGLTPLPMKAIALLSFFLVAISHCEEPKKFPSVRIAGKDYINATITPLDRLTARVAHDSGVARVNIIDIQEDVRNKVIPKEENILTITTETVQMHSLLDNQARFREIFLKVRDSENSGSVSRNITVTQTISKGVMLAMVGDELQLVMLVGDETNRADGDKFETWLKDTGRIQKYTSVLGVEKQVKVMIVSHQMTPEEFMSSLRAGAGYKVQMGYGSITCSDCKGSPATCRTCGSTGKVQRAKMVEVVW